MEKTKPMKTADIITMGKNAEGEYLNGIRQYPVKREVTIEGVKGSLCRTPDGWIVVMNGMRLAQPQKSIALCIATSEDAMRRNLDVLVKALTKAYGALERARAAGVVGDDGRIIPPC